MKQMQQGEASPDPNRHINNLSGHIQKNGPALK